MTFGEKLLEQCESKGLARKDVSEGVGITTRTLRNYENSILAYRKTVEKRLYKKMVTYYYYRPPILLTTTTTRKSRTCIVNKAKSLCS